MRASPKIMANVYFILGILFVFIATKSAGETVWNSITILLALIATLYFGVGIRLMRNHLRKKKE